MNREEAINKLNWALDNNMIEDVQSAYDYIMAIKMAIKALEQEPCEDAISRRDVLDLAKQGVLVSNGNYKSVCKAINDLPPVNPTKTGHWKPYLKEGLRYQCSACDSRFDTPWAYCPHCGCRMVEPQESEE